MPRHGLERRRRLAFACLALAWFWAAPPTASAQPHRRRTSSEVRDEARAEAPAPRARARREAPRAGARREQRASLRRTRLAKQRAEHRAQARIRRGVRAFERGAYARALRLLQPLAADPLACLYAARSHDALGDVSAAIETYARFLALSPSALAAERELAQRRLAVLTETGEVALERAEARETEAQASERPAPPEPEPRPEPQPHRSAAAGRSAARAVLRAARTLTAPRIDGILDESEWHDAEPAGDFTQKTPHGGEAATPTTLRVLYDDDALYVGFDCEQPQAPLRALLARRDRPTESDSVSIAIDTRGDGRSAFELSISAASVQVDGLRFEDGKIAREWDANWEGRAHTREAGWSAELRIPFRVLRAEPGREHAWRIQARRYVAALQELSEWAFIPREAGGEVSHYGAIEGVRLGRASGSFELTPFVVGRARWKAPDPAVVHRGWTFEPAAGADFSWRPGDAMALDGTVLPDFGQVEADRLILNLSNVELRLPEKRPFFLAGLEQLATPTPIFYSRRIGRTPKPPRLGSDPLERAYDEPEPSPIFGALRLAAEPGDGWSIAALSALTGPNELEVVRADQSRSSRLLDPLTSYNVLRVRTRLRRGLDLGATATATWRNEPGFGWPAWLASSASYAAVDPGGEDGMVRCPSGALARPDDRCFHDAYVGSVDVAWRSPEGTYALRGQGYASAIAGGPTRTLADGTRVGAGDTGSGGTLRLSKQGGEHWILDGTIAAHSRKLDFDDLGFMDRQNVVRAGLYVEYRTLDPWHVLLETHTALLLYGENTLDGLALHRGVMLTETAVLENRWAVTLGAYLTAPRFDDREVGDGTALERAGVVGATQALATDPTLPLGAAVQLTEEAFAGGANLDAQLAVTWQPLAAAEVQLTPTYTYAHGEPRYAGVGAVRGGPVFGRLRAESAGVTLRASYGFSPDLTLTSHAQLFLARGEYSDYRSTWTAQRRVRVRDLEAAEEPAVRPDYQRASLTVNVVLRWEYQPGSALYLLYVRSQNPYVATHPEQPPRIDLGLLRAAPATDVLMLKLAYWIR